MRIEEAQEVWGLNNDSHDAGVISEEKAASGSEDCENNVENETHDAREKLLSPEVPTSKVLTTSRYQYSRDLQASNSRKVAPARVQSPYYPRHLSEPHGP